MSLLHQTRCSAVRPPGDACRPPPDHRRETASPRSHNATAARHRGGRHHLDVHVAHAKDASAAPGTVSIPTPPPATGTCSPGPGGWARWTLGCGGHRLLRRRLARFLVVHGQVVLEVNRPIGKPAAAAASPIRWMPRPPPGVQAGEVTACPRPAAATSRCSARCACSRTASRPHPGDQRPQGAGGDRTEKLREQLRGRSATMLVREAAGLRPGPLDDPTAAAKLALRTLARRTKP